jgi:hypothetical protein
LRGCGERGGALSAATGAEPGFAGEMGLTALQARHARLDWYEYDTLPG